MKRASLAVLVFAFIVAAAWPPATAEGAPSDAGLCGRMTPERILSSPEIAAEWERAIRSNDPAEIARMHDVVDGIRAAHGCAAGRADASREPEAAAPLPPGHPPIGGRGALPPGHPPIPATPSLQMFQAPAILEI